MSDLPAPREPRSVCLTCSYSWVTGRSGAHSGSAQLTKVLATLQLEHAEARRLISSLLRKKGIEVKADADWNLLASSTIEHLL